MSSSKAAPPLSADAECQDGVGVPDDQNGDSTSLPHAPLPEDESVICEIPVTVAH